MPGDEVIRNVMRVSYPILAGAALLVCALEVLWYTKLRNETYRLWRSAIWLLEFFSIGLLSMTAGSHPLFSIDVLRPYIALVRLLTLFAFLGLAGVMLIPLWQRAKQYDRDSTF